MEKVRNKRLLQNTENTKTSFPNLHLVSPSIHPTSPEKTPNGPTATRLDFFQDALFQAWNQELGGVCGILWLQTTMGWKEQERTPAKSRENLLKIIRNVNSDGLN